MITALAYITRPITKWTLASPIAALIFTLVFPQSLLATASNATSQTQQTPDASNQLQPVLIERGPSDVEYIQFNSPVTDLDSGVRIDPRDVTPEMVLKKNLTGEFQMLQIAAIPGEGLILKDSHKGSLITFDPNVAYLDELSREDRLAELGVSSDENRLLPDQWHLNRFPSGYRLVDSDNKPLPISGFSMGQRWSVRDQGVLMFAEEVEEDTFVRDFDFMVLGEHGQNEPDSKLTIMDYQALLGGPSEKLPVAFRLTLPQTNLYGTALGRGQTYQGNFYHNRKRVPTPYVPDAFNQLPENAQATMSAEEIAHRKQMRQKYQEYDYDPRVLYVTVGDRLLMLPFGDNPSEWLSQENPKDDPLQYLLPKLLHNQRYERLEEIKLNVRVSNCTYGCYGMDIAPSPRNSQVNWLWVGDNRGQIRIYSLLDPLQPEFIAVIRTPMAMLDPKADRRVMGLSVLKHQQNHSLITFTDAKGRAYVYDASRQILRFPSRGVIEDMDLQLGVAPTELGKPAKQVPISRRRKTSLWQNLNISVATERLKLAELKPDEKVPYLWREHWFQNGGALGATLSIEQKLWEARNGLEAMLATLAGVDRDEQGNAVVRGFQSEHLLLGDSSTSGPDQIAQALADINRWHNDETVSLYSASQFCAIGILLSLMPQKRWFNKRLMRWLRRGATKPKLATVKSTVRRASWAYWLPSLLMTGYHFGYSKLEMGAESGSLYGRRMVALESRLRRIQEQTEQQFDSAVLIAKIRDTLMQHYSALVKEQTEQQILIHEQGDLSEVPANEVAKAMLNWNRALIAVREAAANNVMKDMDPNEVAALGEKVAEFDEGKAWFTAIITEYPIAIDGELIEILESAFVEWSGILTEIEDFIDPPKLENSDFDAAQDLLNEANQAIIVALKNKTRFIDTAVEQIANDFEKTGQMLDDPAIAHLMALVEESGRQMLGDIEGETEQAFEELMHLEEQDFVAFREDFEAWIRENLSRLNEYQLYLVNQRGSLPENRALFDSKRREYAAVVQGQVLANLKMIQYLEERIEQRQAHITEVGEEYQVTLRANDIAGFAMRINGLGLVAEMLLRSRFKVFTKLRGLKWMRWLPANVQPKIPGRFRNIGHSLFVKTYNSYSARAASVTTAAWFYTDGAKQHAEIEIYLTEVELDALTKKLHLLKLSHQQLIETLSQI